MTRPAMSAVGVSGVLAAGSPVGPAETYKGVGRTRVTHCLIGLLDIGFDGGAAGIAVGALDAAGDVLFDPELHLRGPDGVGGWNGGLSDHGLFSMPGLT